MRTLIVEDDLPSRKVLQVFLSPYSECERAQDGIEALEYFRRALDENKPYDLVCLDIMMPGMSGQEVLKEIRRMEAERNIHGLKGVKVIMTTALSDNTNILEAFRSQCEAYLIKPILRDKLLKEMRSLGLIE